MLYDPMVDPKDCLPKGRAKAAGVVIVPKDTHEPILIEWLKRSNAVAFGMIAHAQRRLEHASSHPAIKRLKQHTERASGAFHEALPAPDSKNGRGA